MNWIESGVGVPGNVGGQTREVRTVSTVAWAVDVSPRNGPHVAPTSGQTQGAEDLAPAGSQPRKQAVEGLRTDPQPSPIVESLRP